MADENAAATMVTYYASCPAQLRARAVYVQFSNHRELKTDQAHNNAVGSPTNAIANTSNVSNRPCFLWYRTLSVRVFLAVRRDIEDTPFVYLEI
jgi:hypothetical protein